MKKLIAIAGLTTCLGVSFVYADAVTDDTSVLPVCAPAAQPHEQLLPQDMQYEYVLDRLGLLDSSKGFWRNWCAFAKKYNFEVSVVEGVIVGLGIIMLMAIERDKIAGDKSEWKKRSTAAYLGWLATATWRSLNSVELSVELAEFLKGAVVAGIIFGYVNNVFGKMFGDDAAWYKIKLAKFIKQWDEHRQYTPSELHPLFDRLASRGLAKKFNTLFVHELYKQIAQLSIKKMTERPA